MRRLCAVLPIALGLVAASARADGDLLDPVRQPVDASPNPSPDDTPHCNKEGKQDRNKHDDDGDDDALGPLVLEGLAAPFLIPVRALGDDYRSASLFPRFPYAYDRPGYLWLDHSQDDDPMPPGAHPWSIRADVEDGGDFRNVNRFSTREFLDTSSRFGVSTDWDFFTERMRCGCYDEMTLGDLNLTYRFAQSEWMQMYVGAGGRLLPDRGDTRAGFNFTYGADIFPCKPVVASASFDVGDLGCAGVVRIRGTVGLMHHHWELFGGYDYLRIGGLDLEGPMAGLRLWF